MKRLIYFFPLITFFSITNVYGQTPQIVTPATDTAKMIDILHYDRLRFIKPDSINELTIAAGNVRFQDNGTLFSADSVIHNKLKGIVEAFGNVHINDADSIHTYSQYLIYYVERKYAILKKKVKMTDSKAVLTTEELDYDTQLKIGNYRNGGRVVNGKTVLTSREATYYTELKDVYFKNNVKLKDPAYDLTTDSLLYNTDSQLATFITTTYIRDSSNSNIVTSEGYYDLRNKKARFGRRSVIRDKAVTVTGNDLAIDDETGRFEASGNAVLVDTAQGISIIANDIKADRRTNTFLATLHPLMIIKQDKDSIYVTADTLFAGRLSDIITSKKNEEDTIKSTAVVNASDTANRNRYFQAFHHVRIFSDSLQAVSDSLFYSGRDSIFRLYHNPILWASGNQVTGDTIYLYTKNKKAERLFVFENGMVINKAGEKLFNQLKGTTLDGIFKNGDIDYMRAKGSAESVYYAKDETDAMVGMNTVSGEIIDMIFTEKELNRVVVRKGITGTMYPYRQIPEDKKILKDFKWLEERRPKTRYELFEDLPAVKEDLSSKEK
jgi:lipopolysaccharide export system protein LptA